MYAVVRTGGKQYRVEEGRAVKIERLRGEIGDVIELGDVLLMDDGGSVTVGVPTISGARVLGTIAEQGRSKKIIVFRYKAKTRYRKKTGHRQPFTRVVVEDILLPGQEPKPRKAPLAEPEPAADEPKRPRGRRKAEAAPAIEVESGDLATHATTQSESEQTPVENPTLEAPTAEKPRRSRRKAE